MTERGMSQRGSEIKRSVYMTWAKRHASARYNLANSGILACEGKELGPEAEKLPINGPPVEGFPPLLDAIAAKYGVAREQVVPAQGTSFANFLACATVLEAGDEVLLEQPAYEPLLAAIRYLGAALIRFPRRHEEGWRIDPEDIGRRISSRTRLIVLTSPHNPSGVVADGPSLARIGELADEAGARVLVDEVYRDILFEDAPACAARLSERFITTGSLTKSYGLGGLRCGWVLCEAGLAEHMRRLNDLMGVSGPLPAEAMGAAAFRSLPLLEARTRALIEPNARLVHRFLREHEDLLECVVPRRSMIVFPRLKGAAGSDLLHDRLRQRETSIVPGRFFESPSHFRLGFAVATPDVAEGLRRLSLTLRESSS
jgi:aspartate/methionine/tyrosine aminotransferase